MFVLSAVSNLMTIAYDCRIESVQSASHHMYEARLKSSWTRLIIPNRNLVTVFFGGGELPPVASDALLTTLHPPLENVLQTVDQLEISCIGAPFSWLEKPRNRMGRDLDCMADVVMGFHRSTFPSRTRPMKSRDEYRSHKQFIPAGAVMGLFLLATTSRLALGPTQPPVQWVAGAFTPGIKRPGSEANHSPPSSAEVKNPWSYTSAPPPCFHGLVLK
jgi:hypothetical protein